jgi:mRNA interferase MazF
MGVAVRQYEVYLIGLDPTLGHEISKVRPCVVISPDEMNEALGTVIVVPLTSRSKPYPTRVASQVQGKEGWIVIDQIRTVDKRRLLKRLDVLDPETITAVKSILKEMLVD